MCICMWRRLDVDEVPMPRELLQQGHAQQRDQVTAAAWLRGGVLGLGVGLGLGLGFGVGVGVGVGVGFRG